MPAAVYLRKRKQFVVKSPSGGPLEDFMEWMGLKTDRIWKVQGKERAFLGQVQHKQARGGRNAQAVWQDWAAEDSHCTAVVENMGNGWRCFQNWVLWHTNPMRGW